MRKFNSHIIKTLASLFVFVFFVSTAFAQQAAVQVGDTKNFAILAGSTITNTGSTVVYGDIGLSPGTSFTGSADVVLDGEIHLTNTDASKAKDALTQAYNDVAGRIPVTIIATELGGQTLLPGVYASESGTFEITGTLTLDAQGDSSAIFIFQMASTLVTASNSKVELLKSASSCKVYWQVGSSATLGVNSDFAGRIYASESITLNNGAKVIGQVLAMTSAVTLDNNVISNQVCMASQDNNGLPNTSDNLVNQVLLALSLLLIGISLLYVAKDTYKKD
ncbi:MAG: ice-binding family protein [Erysipelotrichaceae bacterium]|nr:ice-binding family protein [Erysipelotrichaceae bacterium]MDP3306247.1 ice-binding family protein [Erysipelotrichaceae bacterium]